MELLFVWKGGHETDNEWALMYVHEEKGIKN